MSTEPSPEAVEKLRLRLEREAEAGGYHLHPDADFVRGLVRGLLVNQERYGYPSCPCRLASGAREDDRDIICPCDYRDPDLSDYGACYCALYVTADIRRGEREATSIPERRPPREERGSPAPGEIAGGAALSHPVWRCRVCGYLCARDGPPETCPICRAGKERFERFL